METNVFAKHNFHKGFYLRTEGKKKCPYSQYFSYPFIFYEFPRFSAARSPTKLISRSQAHNCYGEAGGCHCAAPCNPDCQIQDGTKGILSF